ncbi:MAG: transcriptional regulator [Aquamicrobium sp.]|uniref:RNA polymerase sigma factor n=1 Tax=Mesorhizobium sp. Pch-S TaxID=2082387 RepID=UPI00101306EC|nr:transcriptional regulator [Mesorhizobium sp. Pch-S]MBR2689832.1 transcriptional regulator [Aquamicrobium sp.]QAZ43765.1 transcriptional regulator [Mesorhizobium sp. Pch-S]
MLSRPYVELLRQAQRVSRRADEAEDLLQAVLLSAIEAGRSDLSCPDNRRWLQGAIRKRAAFEARSAIRRRQRETRWQAEPEASATRGDMPNTFVATLPAALRTTALLALTGHTRREIAWLLRLSDPALRQRIAEIRRRWRDIGGDRLEEIPGLDGLLHFGSIRRALLGPSRRDGVLLASHDPDGHLFLVSIPSQIGMARQQSQRKPSNQE